MQFVNGQMIKEGAISTAPEKNYTFAPVRNSPNYPSFMRPLSIPKHIKEIWKGAGDIQSLIQQTRIGYKNLLKGAPEVSIVIPAYNEEKSILQTLASITQNVTTYSVEIIVANNNSVDRTVELVNACGITCLNEPKQGIANARNCGLKHARGRYIINADADTIYSRNWIQSLIDPLVNHPEIVLTYGKFSFLPIKNTSRFTYFIYETAGDFSRKFNKYFKDEAVNVYGFSSAFRKEHGLMVNGFDHPACSTEDGYLALKLRNKGLGKLKFINNPTALAWTTDRRIHIDGGLWIGTIKRIKKLLFPHKPFKTSQGG